MAKDMTFNDHPKYGITLKTSRGAGIKECFANSITEARVVLFKRAWDMNWSKTSEEISGFAYEYGLINGFWGVKKQLAYVSYDKSNCVLWWHVSGKERRVIKEDGTLGMTQTQFWRNMNQIRGFR